MVMQVKYSNSSDTPDCDVGIPCENVKGFDGEKIFTGDVVLVWHGQYLGTDDECWYPSNELATVLVDQFGKYSTEEEAPFVMFYKNADFTKDYKAQVVKSHKDVVDGEHWTFKGGCSISYMNS